MRNEKKKKKKEKRKKEREKRKKKREKREFLAHSQMCTHTHTP